MKSIFIIALLALFTACHQPVEPLPEEPIAETDHLGNILSESPDWESLGKIGEKSLEALRQRPDRTAPAIAPAWPNPAKVGYMILFPVEAKTNGIVKIFNAEGFLVNKLYYNPAYGAVELGLKPKPYNQLTPGKYTVFFVTLGRTIKGHIVVTKY